MPHFSYILVLLGVSLVASAQTPSSEEDVAVLSAIVTHRCEYAESQPDKHYNILSAQSSAVDHNLASKGLDPEAVKSLERRNQTAHDLPPLTLCKAFRLVPQAKIDAVMDKKERNGTTAGWHGFHKAFPTAIGISYLSLPGYSADGAIAIVQVSGSCDWLCGSGFYWVMRKVAGKWTFAKSVFAWNS